MQRLDERPVPEGPEELRVFAVMRDERLRLAGWLRHYRRLGADRFFVVDNGSTDGTLETLLDQPDVHVFRTTEGFQQGQSGRLWLERLMREFGTLRWCLVADAAELLAFPGWERSSLRTLTGRLSAAQDEALQCVLLDMYSDRPVALTRLHADADPFALCPWFDADFEEAEGSVDHGDRRIAIPTVIGGVRRRAFGIDAYLSKIGLVRYRPEMTLTRGQHGIVGARVSTMRGVVFHFKFLADIVERARIVVEHGGRDNCVAEWRAYHAAFGRSPGMTLHGPRSVRLQDSEQLLGLGLMRPLAAHGSLADAAG